MQNNKNPNFDIELSNQTAQNYALYRKKYIHSRLIYISIGLIIIIISSLQILLNLFAIRWNDEPTIKKIFLVIAIISAIIVFFQSVLLFFDFKGNKEENMAKLRNLQNLKHNYVKNPEEFKTSKMASQIYDIDKDSN